MRGRVLAVPPIASIDLSDLSNLALTVLYYIFFLKNLARGRPRFIDGVRVLARRWAAGTPRPRGSDWAGRAR